MGYYLIVEETLRGDNYHLSVDAKYWYRVPEYRYHKLRELGCCSLVKCSEGTALFVHAELPKAFKEMCKCICEKHTITENFKPTKPEYTDVDYAIMYVEGKLGTGAVMEMMDYIEEKSKQEILA